jgi:hypothetical protein
MMESPKQSATNTEHTFPYKPSLVNRFSDWVERLPGASWSYYLGSWLMLVAAQNLVLWLDGADPLRTYHVAQAFLAGATVLLLGLFLFFDQRAAKALSLIRPVLTIEEPAYRELSFRLTRLPLGGPLVAALVTLGVILLSEVTGTPYWFEPLSGFPASLYFLRVVYFICWGVFGAFIYQTLHRLVLISRIYTQHTTINLYRKKPLYALSNLLALSAISLTVLPLGFLLSNNLTDISLLEPSTIILMLVIQVIAFLSFLWPQLGIHRLQRDEKDKLLDEVNQRYVMAFQELHTRVDQGNLEETSDLSAVITSLEKELKSVKDIAIWPWDTETLRWLVTALLLPIGFMFLRMIFERIFS